MDIAWRENMNKKIIQIIVVVALVATGVFEIQSDFAIFDFLNQSASLNNDNVVFQLGETIEPNLSVDSCDLSGDRKANAIVDIGFDSDYATRDYYARTNESGQLVEVIADEIILQDDYQEPQEGDGRYCRDEAKVEGVQASDLDEGHIIADSLGGVSNAYNITPQNSEVNRYGVQADIEEEIRNAGGATDFHATITYSDTQTYIPSSYQISYKVNNRERSYDFANE